MHATTWDYAPIYTSHVATLQGARVAALTRAWRTQPLAGDKWVCVCVWSLGHAHACTKYKCSNELAIHSTTRLLPWRRTTCVICNRATGRVCNVCSSMLRALYTQAAGRSCRTAPMHAPHAEMQTHRPMQHAACFSHFFLPYLLYTILA